jgi:hypothetical protein
MPNLFHCFKKIQENWQVGELIGHGVGTHGKMGKVDEWIRMQFHLKLSGRNAMSVKNKIMSKGSPERI